MTRPMPGGRRRVDHVLAPDFLDGLTELPLTELRAKRREAEQEEADLSYLRRMLHGRMSIIEAELRHRDPASDSGSVVDELSSILGDEQRSTRGLGRHLTVEPSRVDEHRRGEEQIIADAVISDVAARTDDELRDALVRLQSHETEVSQVRRAVQTVMDTLSAELTSRYRDGSASVDELLAPGSGA
ncbi:MAG TPA: aerial mycelium formation protein [Candidatus Nanopelagicales bacterium]